MECLDVIDDEAAASISTWRDELVAAETSPWTVETTAQGRPDDSGASAV